MTKEELTQKLQGLEWDDFEVKTAHSELPKNIWETVSAFSNTQGGGIVLGVAQHGADFEIVGVKNAEKLEQDFFGTIRSQKFNTRLLVKAQRFNFNGIQVLAFFVPSSENKPVWFGNPTNTFIRLGSGDQHATDDEITQMYHDRSFGVRSEMPVEGTSIRSLNLSSLHGYRNYLSFMPKMAVTGALSDEEFCLRLGITTDDGRLTYAGLIMFGDGCTLLRHVPTFCVDYFEVPGTSISNAKTRYTYRIPEPDNLWESYLVIVRRLRNLVEIPFVDVDEMGRRIEDESQFLILREALVNMLMHMDYFNTLRSGVHVFTDHIEFMNGGNYPIPPDQMIGKFYSKQRNPTIAKFFRFAEIAETAGYGMDKMREWKHVTGGNMSIQSERTFVSVEFYFANQLSVPQDVSQDVPQDVLQAIEHYIRNDSKITRQEIANKLNISTKTVGRYLNKMSDKIVYIGSGYSGHWEIVNSQTTEKQ